MKDYEARHCIICGVEYIPRRSDQRTCGCAECMKERQKLNYREYRKHNYAAVLETNRRSMEKKRKAEKKPKQDTIIGAGYAERQIKATLKMAGKVRTEL